MKMSERLRESRERIDELVRVNAGLMEENARLLRELERVRGWAFSVDDELKHIKVVVGETQAFLERLRSDKK